MAIECCLGFGVYAADATITTIVLLACLLVAASCRRCSDETLADLPPVPSYMLCPIPWVRIQLYLLSPSAVSANTIHIISLTNQTRTTICSHSLAQSTDRPTFNSFTVVKRLEPAVPAWSILNLRTRYNRSARSTQIP